MLRGSLRSHLSMRLFGMETDLQAFALEVAGVDAGDELVDLLAPIIDRYGLERLALRHARHQDIEVELSDEHQRAAIGMGIADAVEDGDHPFAVAQIDRIAGEEITMAAIRPQEGCRARRVAGNGDGFEIIEMMRATVERMVDVASLGGGLGIGRMTIERCAELGGDLVTGGI